MAIIDFPMMIESGIEEGRLTPLCRDGERRALPSDRHPCNGRGTPVRLYARTDLATNFP